jgi:aspartyl-tRNA(Asn)/glutamyl-tRNA(Gln) amidotransferase subunit C
MESADPKKHMDVARVAHLARMHLTSEEIARFGGQMADVLAHVNRLQELETEDIEPTAHAAPVHNVFRADEVRGGLSLEDALSNAPATRDGLFIVPRIIE